MLGAISCAVLEVALPDQHSPGEGSVSPDPPRVSRKPGRPLAAGLGQALNSNDCQSVCRAVRGSREQGEVPAPGAAVRVSDKDITPGPMEGSRVTRAVHTMAVLITRQGVMRGSGTGSLRRGVVVSCAKVWGTVRIRWGDSTSQGPGVGTGLAGLSSCWEAAWLGTSLC